MTTSRQRKPAGGGNIKSPSASKTMGLNLRTGSIPSPPPKASQANRATVYMIEQFVLLFLFLIPNQSSTLP